MELLLGITLYVVILIFLGSIGKFSRDCDETVSKQIRKDPAQEVSADGR